MWLLRTVLREGGGPASGVPVTLFDDSGNPAGYWVSDAEGLVAIPSSDAARVRLRVGLRSEEPIELAAEALAREIVELHAPKSLVPLASRPRVSAAVERAGDVPGQVLHFIRLALLPAPLPGAEPGHLFPPGIEAGAGAAAPVDFLDLADTYSSTLRYGALVEVEQYWQPLGHLAGNLLYTVALGPGDEAQVGVLDRRWSDRPERPLEVLARLIGAPAQVDALAGDEAALPLEPLTLAPSAGTEGGLGAAAAETIHYLNDQATRMSQVLRRRPLRVIEDPRTGGDAAAIRTVRNTTGDRTVAYHFFEPLERYRVTARAARIRPAVLVPFRLPTLATRAIVRQFGHILRRALLDRSLESDLDHLVGAGQREARRELEPPPVSELRLIVERAPAQQAPDLRQVWCFLHVDQTRYTVHFFPADATAGVSVPTETPHWIGAIRLADFHQHPLQYPGTLALQNGSRSMLAFQAVHIEGRVAESWIRLHTVADVVLPPQSQVRLASLAALADGPGVDPREGRLLAHIAANVPYYSAAIIAAGDPAVRYLALSKVRDAAGVALADVIENTVVTVVGNYVAFALRSPEFAPPGLRTALEQYATRPARVPDETVVTIPVPGVWLSMQEAEAAAVESAATDEGQDRPPARGRRTGWPR